jgi:glycosyltransferase involved in cell wall biosynthesis
MKVAVFARTQLPSSIRSCIANITRELAVLGVDCEVFSENDTNPPRSDIFWILGTGRSAIGVRFAKVDRPVVATYHGAANIVLPVRECFGTASRSVFYGFRTRFMTRYHWFQSRNRCEVIVTASRYAKEEFDRYLNYGQRKVIPVYHGIDHEMFFPAADVNEKNRYFLHVSEYQPKKNVDRILAAYQRLPAGKPRLVVVTPGYRNTVADPRVEMIGQSLSHTELSHLYRHAFGLVFPSLHETFGHPIVEAMASGCPVITSNVTACAEVAGDAAVLVNPRSTDGIAAAMKRLMADEGLQKELRGRGIERAKMFSWRTSAREYLSVFTEAVRNHSGNMSGEEK